MLRKTEWAVVSPIRLQEDSTRAYAEDAILRVEQLQQGVNDADDERRRE